MRAPFRQAAAIVAGVAAVAPITQLQAQNPWVASYYPYFYKGPNEKLSVVLHYQYAQLADYDARVVNNGSLSAEGGINADGGRWVVGRFKAPLLFPGWRFYGEVGAVRTNRYGYFGLGNDTEEVESTAEDPYPNRVSRTRYYARADATRQLVGPFSASVGGALLNANFRDLPGETRFALDCDPASLILRAVPGLPIYQDECAGDVDLMGRVSLLVDTRDNEFTPSRGLLVEAGVLGGTGGEGYGGVYGIAQGLVSPREGTVLAARFLGRRLGTGAPLDARYQVFAWERSIPVVGGAHSHRSYVEGRFAAREVLLANLEIRQDILNFGDYGAISALGFFDAARAREIYPGESDEFHLGGGFGLVLRILRASILTYNFAGGVDGFQFSMGTGWAF